MFFFENTILLNEKFGIVPFVVKGTATEKLWDDFSQEVGKLAEISKQIAEKYIK